MRKIVPVQTLRAVEAASDAAGLTYNQLMEHAGRAVAARIRRALETVADEQPRVTFLIGPGNNGGDGLVAARILAEETDAVVRCYLLQPRNPDEDPVFAATQATRILIANAPEDHRYRLLTNLIASAHVLVDALFGIGARLPLNDESVRLLKQVSAALKLEPEFDEAAAITSPAELHSWVRPEKLYTIAVDCPSGLDCDTGDIDPHALAADETITFIAAKPGLLLFPGAQKVGDLHIAHLGVSSELEGLKQSAYQLVDAAAAAEHLPERLDGSHKGTFGKALIVGGSVNYVGAPGLSGLAAYRSGAGLVTIAAPASIVPLLTSHSLEVTWLLLPHDMGVIAASAAQVAREEAFRYQALLVGPGIGRENTTRDMLARLMVGQGDRSRSMGFQKRDTREEARRDERQLPPLVIDADGLFLLSQLEDWPTLLPANTVLTPHPGEMAQLSGLTTEEVQAQRWSLATEKAREWEVVLVLKGAHTLIAAPDGRVCVLPFKTAALATAGTGDILAGFIAGLLAQGCPPFEAAYTAGYIHGLAGYLLGQQVGTRSIIASDVLHDGLIQACALVENAR